MCRSCYDKERNQAHPERRRNYHKKRYSKNPELWKSRARDWVLKNPIKYALRLAKQSAATRGLEFDLDEDYLRSIWTDTCPVFDIKMERVQGDRENGPSLDRIDNSLGYVKGNVQVISLRANRIKNDASLDELEKLVQFMRHLFKV